jgi:hypothetical protein
MIVRMQPDGRKTSLIEAALSKEDEASIEVEAAQIVVVAQTVAEADLTVGEAVQKGVEVTGEEVVEVEEDISFESGQC